MNGSMLKEGWQALSTLSSKVLAGTIIVAFMAAWVGIPRYVAYKTSLEIEKQETQEVVERLQDLSGQVKSLSSAIHRSAREESRYRDSLAKKLLILEAYQVKTMMNQSIIVGELQKTNKEISRQIEINNKAQEKYIELLSVKKNSRSESLTYPLVLGRSTH